MNNLRFVIFCLFLFITSSAFAVSLDEYYLEQFGEKATTISGTLFKAASQPAVKKCGLPLHKSLKADWKKLELSTQQILAKYLAAPALIGEGIIRSNGGHFNIHYSIIAPDAPPLTDADNNGIPDWVESVANTFEAVYAREVTQLGYRQPPNIPYDIYLQQLAPQGFFGFTESAEPSSGIISPSYIVIDNDFADSIYQPYGGLNGLNITAAHEFHHAIQFGYNFYFETWYAEATSSWMEDEVYDSINQLYEYLFHYYLQPQLALDTAVNLGTGGGYGRWSFNRYLSEIFYPTTIVKSIWEDLATKTPSGGLDIPMLPVINEVLAANGGSLPTSFLGFSKRFLLNDWFSHQNELGLFPDLTFNGSNTFAVTTTFTVPATSLPNYAFTYLMLLPSSAAPVTLTISYPGKPAAYGLIAFVQTGSNTSQYPADNSGTITIPGVTQFDTVYLLICNNTIGTTSAPADPAQAISSPTDATNPYPGSATIIQAPVLTPPTTSGGGGGGGSCFIATAAYGSYLHPEVMTLRVFRDRHLLTNLPGRVLVAAYYKTSPPIADFIREHETVRFIVRILLVPIIFAVKHGWLALSAILILALTAFVRMRYAPK